MAGPVSPRLPNAAPTDKPPADRADLFAVSAGRKTLEDPEYMKRLNVRDLAKKSLSSDNWAARHPPRS